MSIIRMYLSTADAKRPTHYREAWWEADSKEFVLHHGKVGETGTTQVETVSDPNEVESLLASFVEQNQQDQYVEVDAIPQESFTVSVKHKGHEPTEVESTNAEKFLAEYTALLAWRGLGAVDDWRSIPGEGKFSFYVRVVHRNKAAKLAAEALKKTDFRADRMSIERN